MATRLSKLYPGLAVMTTSGPKWTGEILLDWDALREPLRWRPRKSGRNPGANYMVFVGDMSDLFHDGVPDNFLHSLWAVFAATPWIDWQVLTKRPEWMSDFLNSEVTQKSIADELTRILDDDRNEPIPWPLPNVWLGTSVENQQSLDGRLPKLIECPAAIRFLSCEPLLDAIRIPNTRAIHWVIVGGESGPKARPFDLKWLDRIGFDCALHGVKLFVKQYGSNPVHCGEKLRLNDRHGGDMSEWPQASRQREFPR